MPSFLVFSGFFWLTLSDCFLRKPDRGVEEVVNVEDAEDTDDDDAEDAEDVEDVVVGVDGVDDAGNEGGTDAERGGRLRQVEPPKWTEKNAT